MSSWTGKGAATQVYSPDFDADFSRLPQRIQNQIEAKFNGMGLRLGWRYRTDPRAAKQGEISPLIEVKCKLVYSI